MALPKILLNSDRRLAAFAELSAHEGDEAAIVGWREWAGLPALGIGRVKAKLDTGARTSALHANSIQPFKVKGVPWVRFDVAGESLGAPWHEARVADRRTVRSSNGESEQRFLIRTDLLLAGRLWPAEITLTNREKMDLPMLVGREALAGRVLVDPARSWLWGRPNWRAVPSPGKAKLARRKERA